jgi:hypothetical protein
MRLNFEFTEEQVKDLKALQEKTGTDTMKDLFNDALIMLEWAVDETANGNDIAAINEENDRYRVLITPVLQRVARQQAKLTALAS